MGMQKMYWKVWTRQHVVDERSMFWKAGMKDYKHGVGNLRNGELVFGTSFFTTG